ncbi:MAG: hypothetical protein ACR9NN_22910 [Nostochopsis sp.]
MNYNDISPKLLRQIANDIGCLLKKYWSRSVLSCAIAKVKQTL